MVSTAPQYLIQDPYHDYAGRFMDLLHRRYGWRAVCMYTDPTALRMNASRFPQLRSPQLVAASYRVTDGGLPGFVDQLRSAHDIRAVVPHYEPSVLPAAHLAAALGLSWAQPDVLWRFRDKLALKAHLSTVDPGLRVNLGRLVSSPAEAAEVAQVMRMKRFVLKPNDGFGNVSIGVFDAGDDTTVAEYWSAAGADSLLLEEFVDGPEYYVNGQTDADGNVQVVDVAEYVCTGLDARQNLKIGVSQLSSVDPVFREVEPYVERVVRASGLRRSPFHAEVKRDEAGPCLIECAARLVGAHVAPLVNLAHGGSLDVFDLAAHYYVTDEPYGDSGVNWHYYDRHPHGLATGLAQRTERIYSVSGIAEVERLPEFCAWVKQPEIGERLHTTTDIFGPPYIAYVQGAARQDLAPTIRRILDLVRWNTEPRDPAAIAAAGWALARRRFRQLPTAHELRMRRFP